MMQTTFKPQMEVRLDGTPLPDPSARSVREAIVRRRAGRPSMCQIELTGSNAPLERHPKAGAALELALPDGGVLFAGVVHATAWRCGADGTQAVRITGVDGLGALSLREPTRLFRNATSVDIAREVVGGMQLQVDADEGPRWRRILQWNQSDLALVVDALALSNLTFWLDDDQQLRVFAREGWGTELELRWGESLFELNDERRDAWPPRQVEGFGWNPLRAEAAAESVDVGGPTILPELPGLEALAAGHERRMRRLGGLTLSSSTEPGYAARREADRMALAAARWRGVAEGDPALAPGRPVRLVGTPHAPDEPVTLGVVEHRLSAAGGYVCVFESLTVDDAPRASSLQATLGIVRSLDDPDRLGRVQLELPALGDLESDWLPVAAAGAGAGKGLLTLPDVGDSMLVLLTDPMLGQGVVLAGLYGTKPLPDGADGSGSPQRFSLMTPGGQRVRLDDDARTIVIENDDGSSLEMAPRRVRLRAKADLHLEAPGHGVVIRGRKIDFEEA